MKALMKFVGVPAVGLGRLVEFLKLPEIQSTKEGKKRQVELKDARIMEGSKDGEFVVNLEVLLVDKDTSGPADCMTLWQLRDLVRSLYPQSVSEFDRYCDGEKDLPDFIPLIGELAAFDLLDASGTFILQKGKPITLNRLKEIVGAKPHSLQWTLKDAGADDKTRLLNRLLEWWNDGGALQCLFSQYRGKF